MRELEAAIRTFLDHSNGDPRPFRWTKTGDQILDSVRRFCEHTLADHVPEMLSRTSDSGLPTATHPRCQVQHS